jgi:hypothetical protein
MTNRLTTVVCLLACVSGKPVAAQVVVTQSAVSTLSNGTTWPSDAACNSEARRLLTAPGTLTCTLTTTFTATTAPTPQPGKFTIGQTVAPISLANVRPTPAGGPITGTQPGGATAIVMAGPQAAVLNGTTYNWWSLNFTTGPDGWVADNNLEAASGTPDPPSPPPPTSGVWPTGWNDPRFVNMRTITQNSYNMSGTTTNFEITTTSGEPMIGCANFTARFFRIKGREGVRLCAPGNVLLEDGYIEAIGAGADHADGVQSYGGSGMQNVVLRRVNIVVGGAANAGVFLADNANVDLTMESVQVDGSNAPNGALFFANVPGDKGCNSLRLNDVVAIGGVRFEGLGTCIIHDWTNVRDGNGRPIPRPN